MSDSEEIKNLHKGHRDRLRKKFYESDGDAIEPHELLELLLYSVNSQKNTNPVARKLIMKFGTIYNVFSASEEELAEVEGIGPQTITLLKLQAALLRKYYTDIENGRKNMRLTPKNAGKYAVNFFYGYSKETAILFSLDKDCRVICSTSLGKGSADRVHVTIRDIVKIAIDTKAVYLILAHNHPNGTLKLSEADIKMTLEIEKALSFLNIKLLDHIIVADGKYVSMSNQLDVYKEENI